MGTIVQGQIRPKAVEPCQAYVHAAIWLGLNESKLMSEARPFRAAR
jgi:hypothetical protein